MTEKVSYVSKPAVVYIVRGIAGRVLYVGVTQHLGRRMSAHRHHRAPWLKESMEITTEHFDRRWPAEQREEELIAKYQPPYNVKHTRKVVTLRVHPSLKERTEARAAKKGIKLADLIEGWMEEYARRGKIGK